MPTVHEQYEQVLPEYILGTLTAGSVCDVEHHLRSCTVCRARLSELKPIFRTLKEHSAAPPPPHYFGTVLSRVRERIGQGRLPAFFGRPWITRIATPLAAMLLAIALIVNLPLSGQNEDPLSLRELVGSLKSEELVDMLVEQTGRESLTQASGAEAVAGMFPERLVSREIARTMLDQQNIAEAAFPQLLADVNKEELELILQKLGERTLL